MAQWMTTIILQFDNTQKRKAYNPDSAMDISWILYEKFVKNLLKICEKLMKNLWKICEKFVEK